MLFVRSRLLAALAAMFVLTVLVGLGLSFGRPERATANPLGGITQISGGVYHSCAVMTNGDAKCWGTLGGLVPTLMPGLTNEASVSSGLYHSCFVSTGGSVKCIGDGFGTTPVDIGSWSSGVVSVSAGWEYTCALKTTGGIECFFTDGTPLAATGLTSGITQVAASNGFHTCVLMNTGIVKCWGFNEHGQIGDGTTILRPTAVQVSGITNATEISLGTFYGCALTAAGGVKCWGDGFGLSPVDVPGLTSGVAHLAANVEHLCVVTTSGGVKCRGANHFGQLGDNQECGTLCTSPVVPAGLASGVARVSLGVEHTCAVLTTGTAKCWGFNGLAGLGLGFTSRQSAIPVDVVVSEIKPTPTATPCPPAGCPSPTPTPYVPRTGLDFSLGIDANGDNHDDCQTRFGPTTCNLQVGAPFNLKVYLNGLPPDLAAYAGMDLIIPYTGIMYKNSRFWQWPDCIFPAQGSSAGVVAFGCSTVGGSTFTGQLLRAVFTCSASGTVALDHGGPGGTKLINDNGVGFAERQGISDALTVNCVNLPPTPTFTPGPPPTPQSVGGIALDAGDSGGGNASPVRLLILAACVTLAVLACAPLVARRALRR